MARHRRLKMNHNIMDRNPTSPPGGKAEASLDFIEFEHQCERFVKELVAMYAQRTMDRMADILQSEHETLLAPLDVGEVEDVQPVRYADVEDEDVEYKVVEYKDAEYKDMEYKDVEDKDVEDNDVADLRSQLTYSIGWE